MSMVIPRWVPLLPVGRAAEASDATGVAADGVEMGAGSDVEALAVVVTVSSVTSDAMAVVVVGSRSGRAQLCGAAPGVIAIETRSFGCCVNATQAPTSATTIDATRSTRMDSAIPYIREAGSPCQGPSFESPRRAS